MSLCKRRRVCAVGAACVAAAIALPAWAQPAFPGAEGFGGSFTGTPPPAGWFSNATVYHVTTTADTLAADGKPAVGTLRGAFYDAARKQQNSNVLVVFDVGGVFQLTQGSLDIKTVNNIYVAGQTAPTPVTVYGNTTQITKSSNTMTSNVILRYMTFRKGTADGEDAITFAGGDGTLNTVATNMILDHVSASWSEDEVLSVANNNTNVTVQYSVIADALVSSHAYGSLIRPRVSSNVTFHHNLYANNASRNPRPGTYYGTTLTFDFRNNVVYNWRDRAGYAGGSSEAAQEYVNINYVGNYLIAGPATTGTINGAFLVDKNVDVVAYSLGNLVDSDKLLNPGGQPNGSDPGSNMFRLVTPVTDQTLTMVGTPFAAPTVVTQSANDAYWQVINHVGNYWWAREAIDARIINNVLTNTNPPSGVGAAAPNAAELAALLATPVGTRPAGFDTDNDGMPNAWETARGLNPNLATDFKLDYDNDGYTNLEEYLNELGAWPAPTAAVWTGGIGRFALNGNWSTWQPSQYDTAKINSGRATVDAVGQLAGNIHVGVDAGGNGELAVASGWLTVSNSIEVGSAGGSQGTLTVSGGTLNVPTLAVRGTGTATYSGGTLNVQNLTLTGAARMTVTGAPAKTLKVNSLSIDAAAVLDLTNKSMVIDYTGSPGTLENDVRQHMYSGRIISSAAGTPPGAKLGYADNAVLGLSSFAGLAVDSSSLLIKFTYAGDANLDGQVDITDLGLLATGWQSSGFWVNGDFDYSGFVDITDLGILATNWQAGVGNPLGPSLDEALSSLGLPSVSVPEPTTGLIGLCLAGAALCRRRVR